MLRAARLLLVAALPCAACGPPPGGAATGPLAAPALIATVGALADPALAGRDAGSPGEAAAARIASDALTAMGLQPLTQEVAYGAGSRNVYAWLPAAPDATSDDVIVLGAHLDHLGVRGGALYPGADDDASGVALVLGVASALRGAHLSRAVLVVLFGAEERGLVGSRAFVAHPPVPLARVRAMVNVDMIARPLLDQAAVRPALWLVGIDRDAATGLVGARRFPGLRALADHAFAAAGAGILVAGEDLPPVIGRQVDAQSAGRSDSAAFEAAGIPALFFGDGESRDYHRPTDTIDKLAPGLLARRADAIARVVTALAAAPPAAFAPSADAPPERTPPGGWYAPIGVTTGAAFAHGARGVLIGGEASLAYLDRARLAWAGGYVDALHDGATGATRLSIGPELGTHGLGLDGGYVASVGGAAVRHGAAVRVVASAALLALGARVGYLAGDGWFGEVTLSVKLPIAARTHR